MKQLVPVVIGFFLTTVVGGLLGFLLQNRGWEHQHQVLVAEQEHERKMQVAEQEREKATQIFDEISRLMDRRLYRLRLVYWTLTESDHADCAASLETRWEDYQQVLYEWNDSINRNLALLQRYFGQEIRDRLDYAVGASFVTLGRKMQEWKKSSLRPNEGRIGCVESELKELSNLVYAFNLEMIRAIQCGTVGPLALKNH